MLFPTLSRTQGHVYKVTGSTQSNEGLLSFTNLSDEVQTHLTKVYQLLTVCMVFSVVGCAVQIKYLAVILTQQWIMLPLLLVLIAIMIAIACINKTRVLLRMGLLFAFSWIQGLILGPLVNQAIEIDPNIVRMAFLLTLMIFASLSVMSMLTKRRKYMYLGSILNSFCIFLIFMSFFPSEFGYRLALFGGLFMFCGYVFYDTQVIIARVERTGIESADFVSDCIQLYIDFVAIFVRILIILMRSRNNRDGGSSHSGGSSGGISTRNVKIDL